MSTRPILIADIGGTNARFALSEDDAAWFNHAQSLLCNDYATLFEAIDSYLQSQKISALKAICLAVAGPVDEDHFKFVNNHWSFSVAEMQTRYAVEAVKLLNDFEAVSYYVARLDSSQCIMIGGDNQTVLEQHADMTLGIVGPGSGLGVAGLKKVGQQLIPLPTEGGHVGFAPITGLQDQLLRYLRDKYPRVSNERILSGPGISNIHEGLCAIRGIENPGLSPSDITLAASENSDPLCVDTMNLFYQILGQVVGDVALNLGAFDGMFIGGGIVQRYPKLLLSSDFRAAFESKGRYQTQMELIPTWLITHKNPGLAGASVYANLYL